MRHSFHSRGGDHHGGHEVRAEINVTSLVDVAFTLLIIFMITAPILQGGVEIDVPRAPAAPLQASEGVVISVDGQGQLYVDDSPVSMAEFESTVIPALRRRGSPTVFLKGAEEVAYGRVLRVIGLLKEAEVERARLVAEPGRRD